MVYNKPAMPRPEILGALALSMPPVPTKPAAGGFRGESMPVPGRNTTTPKSLVETFMPGQTAATMSHPPMVRPTEPTLASRMPGLSEMFLLKLPAVLQNRLPTDWMEAKLHPNLHETAQHEFRHAFVAWQMGIPVLQVSVEPDSVSWGRTIVAPGDLKKSQIISMAGKLPTDYGGAKGTASDEHQTMIGTFMGGLTVQDAYTEAQAVFKQCSPKVAEIAVRMITLMGTVSGSEFAHIMHHAAYLMHAGGLIDRTQYEAERQKAEFNAQWAENFGPLPGKMVTIIDTKDTVHDNVVYVGNNPKEKKKCPGCGTTGNTHFPGCQAQELEPTDAQTIADSVARRSARARLLNGEPERNNAFDQPATIN